jgi:hypothetical protein
MKMEASGVIVKKYRIFHPSWKSGRYNEPSSKIQ